MTDEFVGFFLHGAYVFDNFAPFQINYEGKIYPTVEHAFQSLKYAKLSPATSESIRQLSSPEAVFSYTRQPKLDAFKDPEWASIKVSLMEELIRAKFDQHEVVKETLASTGTKRIVEMNDNDSFWGWGPGPDHAGQNELGNVWMRLREQMARL